MGEDIPQLNLGGTLPDGNAGGAASSGVVAIPESLWFELLKAGSPSVQKVLDENLALKKQLGDASLINMRKDLRIAELEAQIDGLQRQLAPQGQDTGEASATPPPSATASPAGESDGEEPMEIYRAHFSGEVTTGWVRSVWRFALGLFREFGGEDKTARTVYRSMSPVCALYLVLADKTHAHRFKGSAKDFAISWNENVARRLDKRQSGRYTCNPDSLNAALRRHPWKGTSPDQWRRLSTEAETRDGHYAMAAMIKGRFDRFLVGMKNL